MHTMNALSHSPPLVFSATQTATYAEGEFAVLEVTHAQSLPAGTELTVTITAK